MACFNWYIYLIRNESCCSEICQTQGVLNSKYVTLDDFFLYFFRGFSFGDRWQRWCWGINIFLVHPTNRCSYSIALGVYETPNLCEVAVPLADVLDAGGLHQHGVVCCQDAGDTFSVVLNQSGVLPAAHKGPHLFISGDLWFLRSKAAKS